MQLYNPQNPAEAQEVVNFQSTHTEYARWVK